VIGWPFDSFDRRIFLALLEEDFVRFLDHPRIYANLANYHEFVL
jgi:hypothetical protein